MSQPNTSVTLPNLSWGTTTFLTQSELSEIPAVRPAHRDDIVSLAALLVQLYDAELPGALIGSLASRQALLRFTLEADPKQSLRHRYVVCLDDGEVVATGMMQRPTDPAFERAPSGTLGQARRLLGNRGAFRLLFTVARSLIGIHRQADLDTVLFHSMVVDEHYRGRGLGRRLTQELEWCAVKNGYRRAAVQVLVANKVARQLYVQLGYRELMRTPRWLRALTWPSYVMEKSLYEPHVPDPF